MLLLVELEIVAKQTSISIVTNGRLFAAWCCFNSPLLDSINLSALHWHQRHFFLFISTNSLSSLHLRSRWSCRLMFRFQISCSRIRLLWEGRQKSNDRSGVDIFSRELRRNGFQDLGFSHVLYNCLVTTLHVSAFWLAGNNWGGGLSAFQKTQKMRAGKKPSITRPLATYYDNSSVEADLQLQGCGFAPDFNFFCGK